MSYDYECESTTEGYTVEGCPFCGSSWTELYIDHVQCNSCQAQGPELDNWEQALKAWNEMPKLEGIALRRQRSKWLGRYRRQRIAHERRLRELAKAERNSPEAKQTRADKKWAADRAAWLARPVNEDLSQ